MNIKQEISAIEAAAEGIRQRGRILQALAKADIRTSKQPNGEWSAIDDRTYDGPGSPMGWGDTQDEAVDDLLEQLADRGFYASKDTVQ